MHTIRLIIKWKLHLGLLMLAAVVLSAIFSSRIFITPLYRSFAILYPSNIKPYSTESESEQMLQMLQSGDIRDSVIQKFDLGKYYNIDPQDKHFQSRLLNLYGQRVNIKRTEYESIIVEVFDKDAQQACDMTNAIIRFYDSKVRSLQKVKYVEVVNNFRLIVDRKQRQLDSLKAAIDEVGERHGVKDLGKQSMELVMGLRKSAGKEDGGLKKDVIRKMDKNMNLKDGELVMLTSLAMSEAEAYSELKLRYDQAIFDYNRNYSFSNIITRPYVADQVYYPKTWIIIGLTVLATFFLSLLTISFIENQRNTKGTENLPG